MDVFRKSGSHRAAAPAFSRRSRMVAGTLRGTAKARSHGMATSMPSARGGYLLQCRSTLLHELRNDAQRHRLFARHGHRCQASEHEVGMASKQCVLGLTGTIERDVVELHSGGQLQLQHRQMPVGTHAVVAERERVGLGAQRLGFAVMGNEYPSPNRRAQAPQFPPMGSAKAMPAVPGRDSPDRGAPKLAHAPSLFLSPDVSPSPISP